MIANIMGSKLTGRGVLMWLFAFFGVIFATNFYFVAMSVKTFSGEDDEDPYMQGIQYNNTLANRAEQARLGWHATISSNRLSSGKLEIDVTIAHPDRTPETGVTLKGQLRHPADQGRDQPLDFHQVSTGTYAVDVANVTPGSWEVLVQNTGKVPFMAVRTLWVR
jgi:nitrogen fixation protein FixH